MAGHRGAGRFPDQRDAGGDEEVAPEGDAGGERDHRGGLGRGGLQESPLRQLGKALVQSNFDLLEKINFDVSKLC